MTKKTAAIITATAIAGTGAAAGVAVSKSPAPGTAKATRALDTAADVGRPYDLERDRYRGRHVWEVDVTPRTQLVISADGKRVVRRSTTERSDDAARVGSAKVSLATALRTADRRASGRLSEAELDRERGRLVWSATFERGATETEVEVDATTGKVVSVRSEQDD